MNNMAKQKKNRLTKRLCFRRFDHAYKEKALKVILTVSLQSGFTTGVLLPMMSSEIRRFSSKNTPIGIIKKT